MLSQELRPYTFDEMAGQEENIKIMQAILKNPDQAPKCLIFSGAFGSGKSTSARILARELNGIKDRDYDILNSPFYYEYDSTVIGNIDTIRQLRDQFAVSYGDYFRVYVFDECVRGDVEILLEDGTYKPIKEIVDNELKIKVMSYNSKTGKTEPKRITGWFKNSPKVFYTVNTTKVQKGEIKISDNHKFITPEGNKTLKELHIGDKIYRYDYKLSEDEEQVIIGGMFGDGSMDTLIESTRFSPRYYLSQGHEQMDWLKLKVNMLSNLNENSELYHQPKSKSPKEFENSDVYTWSSLSKYCLRDVQRLFFDHPNRIKRVKRSTLDKLKPLGLAVWYLDDGCLHISRYEKADGTITESPIICLHTEGFTEDEDEIICKYFKEVWGIKATKTRDGCGHSYISMGRESSRKFLKIVAPYIVEGILDYKLGNFEKPGNGMLNITKGEYNIVEDVITEIKLSGGGRFEPSYDIEVEDNHNYFGNSILVHNCHAISNAAQNSLLKVLEEAIGKVIFIMCTTEPNKLLPTIRSRSLELEFLPVPMESVVQNLTNVCDKRGINLSNDLKLLIADRSAGHMRNAHMLSLIHI